MRLRPRLHRWFMGLTDNDRVWLLFGGALLILFLSACKIPPINIPTPPAPTPVPIPTPTPTSPPPCMASVPWCHEVVPTQTCSTTEKPCKHNPTEDPAYCELAPACVVPPEEPPPPVEPPSTDCNPTLNPSMGAPANDDTNWVRAADQTATTGFKQAVWQAVRSAQAACPVAWTGNCMKAGEPGIDQGYLLIAKELQRVGWSASQAKDSNGKVYDHLYVRRTSVLQDWNATKLFYYGNGCLITGDGAFTVHGWYTFIGSDPTSPPVDPPPTASCPAEPCPIRRWSADNLPPGWGDNEIGKSAWKFNAKVHTMGNCDSTPVTRNQEPYCRAIGMSPMADGNLRAACPMRNEIPGQPNPDRESVETWLLEGGPKREGRNGQDCTPNNTTNPFAFLAGTGNCRICNTPGDTCSEWF